MTAVKNLSQFEKLSKDHQVIAKQLIYQNGFCTLISCSDCPFNHAPCIYFIDHLYRQLPSKQLDIKIDSDKKVVAILTYVLSQAKQRKMQLIQESSDVIIVPAAIHKILDIIYTTPSTFGSIKIRMIRVLLIASTLTQQNKYDLKACRDYVESHWVFESTK